jgi:ribosome maturation protein SDO1
MVSLEDSVIARLNKKGSHFEVLVDPYAAADLIDGKKVGIVENLAIDSIFKDAKKGDIAPTKAMMDAFGTIDIEKIAREIIINGNIQLTTKQRKEMKEAKEKKIIDLISRSAMDPQTKSPIPPSRIKLAMDESGVSIDPFKAVDEQVKEVLDKIRPIIPISMEKIKIEIKVASKYIGRAYGAIRNFGSLIGEKWKEDGSWMGIIELSAGRQTEFYDQLNELTKGNVETRIVK